MNQSIIACALFCLIAAVTVSAEPGFVSVYNSGGYVARAFAEWETKDGKFEKEDTGDFTLGVTETIKIPDGAKNVYVKVINYIFFGATSNIFSQTFDGPVKKCYKVWGFTLNPSHSEISC